jgi:hypothetical protein
VTHLTIAVIAQEMIKFGEGLRDVRIAISVDEIQLLAGVNLKESQSVLAIERRF